MDLRDIIAITWKRKATLLVVVLVALLVGGALALTRTKEYQAQATLAMTPNVQKGQGFVASDDLATLLSTYGAIATSATNKGRAAQLLGRPLGATVASSTSAGTGILEIQATSTDPVKAAADARALATAFEQTIANNGLLLVQLVDPATVPSAAVQPRPPLILAASLVLGLGVGIALVLILERWFSRVEDVDDLKEVTPVPVVGQIPRSRALRGGGPNLLVWTDTELVGLQEAFRALRTSLQFSIDSPRDVLQITSASPGDGKSTVAANLAIAIASVGIPTLLVDADLRSPTQHEIFDLPNHEGLSTVMSAQFPKNGRPGTLPATTTEYPNLSVLTSGPTPPGPTELIHTRIEPTIERLRQENSFIVLDSPPVLPISDANLIASHVDGLLLVVNAGGTKSAWLRQTIQLLLMARGPLIGIVLNQTTDMLDSAGYYRYRVRGADRPELVGKE